jgi:hypothetical protein
MTFDAGFAGSAGIRLCGALAFAVLACVAVMVVEYGGRTPTTLPVPIVAKPMVSGRLILETTFPVARWTVEAQGRDVIATTVSPQRWEAPIAGDGATIFIQAESADPTSVTPVALRWNYAGKTGLWWGEGSVAETLASDAPVMNKTIGTGTP